LDKEKTKILNEKHVLLSLGCPNMFISLKMNLLMSNFFTKGMVPLLHKPHVSI